MSSCPLLSPVHPCPSPLSQHPFPDPALLQGDANLKVDNVVQLAEWGGQGTFRRGLWSTSQWQNCHPTPVLGKRLLTQLQLIPSPSQPGYTHVVPHRPRDGVPPRHWSTTVSRDPPDLCPEGGPPLSITRTRQGQGPAFPLCSPPWSQASGSAQGRGRATAVTRTGCPVAGRLSPCLGDIPAHCSCSSQSYWDAQSLGCLSQCFPEVFPHYLEPLELVLAGPGAALGGWCQPVPLAWAPGGAMQASAQRRPCWGSSCCPAQWRQQLQQQHLTQEAQLWYMSKKETRAASSPIATTRAPCRGEAP